MRSSGQIINIKYFSRYNRITIYLFHLKLSGNKKIGGRSTARKGSPSVEDDGISPLMEVFFINLIFLMIQNGYSCIAVVFFYFRKPVAIRLISAIVAKLPFKIALIKIINATSYAKLFKTSCAMFSPLAIQSGIPEPSYELPIK